MPAFPTLHSPYCHLLDRDEQWEADLTNDQMIALNW